MKIAKENRFSGKTYFIQLVPDFVGQEEVIVVGIVGKPVVASAIRVPLRLLLHIVV